MLLEQEARLFGVGETGEIVEQPGQPQRLLVHRLQIVRVL